jgi:ubiquinone/menaquinone biosynthesis C-methylase UbiE
MSESHDVAVQRAFTAQAAGYNASAVANAAEILKVLLAAAAPRAGEHWLEAACGTGIVSRALAPLVGSVHGVDLTPAMIELARREASAAGITNAGFEVADATATGLPAASVDGAITRFSLHHVPVPGRLLGELARVVRPGGRIVVADHLADADAEARSWVEEIERLRDPAHWASLSAVRLRELGRPAGLTLEQARTRAFTLDFDDWLARGGAGATAQDLVERGLAQRPFGTECFTVRSSEGARVLRLQLWVGVWRRG